MVSAENKPIREWTYKVVQTLPPDQQKEWRKACTTELDMCKGLIYLVEYLRSLRQSELLSDLPMICKVQDRVR